VVGNGGGGLPGYSRITVCVEGEFADPMSFGFAYTGGSRENCSCIVSSRADKSQPLNTVD